MHTHIQFITLHSLPMSMYVYNVYAYMPLLLTPTLVVFCRGKGTNGLIHAQKPIYSFNKYLLNTHYVPATVWSLEIVLNNIEQNTCLIEIYLLAGNTDTRQLVKNTKTSTIW